MALPVCRRLSAADQNSFNDLFEGEPFPIEQPGAQRYGAFEVATLVAAVGIGQGHDGDLVLFDLFVKPTARGRGVASCLVNWLKEKICDEAPAIRLTVRGDNHQAMRLYQRTGFQVIQRNNKDLVMRCRF